MRHTIEKSMQEYILWEILIYIIVIQRLLIFNHTAAL